MPAELARRLEGKGIAQFGRMVEMEVWIFGTGRTYSSYSTGAVCTGRSVRESVSQSFCRGVFGLDFVLLAE